VVVAGAVSLELSQAVSARATKADGRITSLMTVGIRITVFLSLLRPRDKCLTRTFQPRAG
jgi:hypothetical protein